jgi:hypothetical protein
MACVATTQHGRRCVTFYGDALSRCVLLSHHGLEAHLPPQPASLTEQLLARVPRLHLLAARSSS